MNKPIDFVQKRDIKHYEARKLWVEWARRKLLNELCKGPIPDKFKKGR